MAVAPLLSSVGRSGWSQTVAVARLVRVSSAAARPAHRTASSTVITTSFGTTSDGRPARAFTLQNTAGMTAVLTDFGATLVSFEMPDRDGRLADVVLGFDDVRGYESDDNQYFGCVVGRVANRLAGASFELGGRRYRLAANNGPNSLHGGVCGFDKRLWQADPDGAARIAFRYRSADGEEGYPGVLQVCVTYSLHDDGRLVLDYEATSDAETLCNLTHHSYFNLAGHGAASVLEHELRIDGDRFTPADDTLVPDGSLQPVEHTALDFRIAKPIGRDIAAVIDGPALGYDHNYVLNDAVRDGRAPAAELHDPASGRTLAIATDQPGLQLYSGNYLSGQRGKGGSSYAQRSACCLEAQKFPAAPSHAHFPSIVLAPGQTYRQVTGHHFFVR